MIHPVLLCGGSGSRLWPLSRTHYPKQFLRLIDEFSLLQNTVRRLDGLNGLSKTIAVANENHRFLLAEQMQELGQKADILLEPTARNTAPAVAAAALYALAQIEQSKDGGNSEVDAPMLLVLPSDHLIGDIVTFRRSIDAAIPHARAGALVTFGIPPERAETGYGYIHRGEAVEGGYNIDSFVEKPDTNTAKSYLDSGEYFWNSGMFLFRADSYLSALSSFAPVIHQCVEKAVVLAQHDLEFIRLDQDSFAASPSDSIDYAVMEKVNNGIVIPMDAGWNDIGSWDALENLDQSEADCNTLRGDVLTLDTHESIVITEGRLVATVGINDVIVVATPDAVLVADKNRAQDVKLVVEKLKQKDRMETEFQHIIHRPWGSYESIANGARHQVKRIVVKPGASLSMQKHHHRAEHWVVVKGTAKVLRGDESLLLSENQSTYIPLGVVHRLENPGHIDLEIVEVQTGSYLGEDDIVRLEDNYGR